MAAVRGRGITSFGGFLDSLSISGGSTAAVITPARRKLLVRGDDRRLEVDAGDRHMEIRPEVRTLIPEDD